MNTDRAVHHNGSSTLTDSIKGMSHRVAVWNQTHIKFLIVAAVIMIDCLDDVLDFYSDPTEATPWNIGWLVACCCLCALSLLPRRYDLIGPLILVVCFNACIFSPHINAFESDLSYLYAMACIAYAIGRTRFLSIPAVFIIAISTITAFSPNSDAALDIFIDGFSGLAFGIIANSWQSLEELRTQKEKLARLHQQQDEERQNLAIAARMHDRIANDAAGIIALAEASTLHTDADADAHKTAPSISAETADKNNSPSHPDEPAESSWNIVAGKARGIYQESHNIMALLEKEPESSPHSFFIAKIKGILDNEQHRLNEEGFEGLMLVMAQDGQPDLPAPQEQEVLELIHEFSTNIHRHMAANGTFNLTVYLSTDSCRIVEMNSTANPPVTRGHKSGRGLALHRRLLERFGGSLTYDIDNDMWMVTAIIPE